MAEPVPQAEENKIDPSQRLYVSNLKWELQDAELKELFGKHGNVVEARIVRDGYDRSRGYGFVTFDNADSANKAVEALNNVEIQERAIRVELARSTGPTAPGTGRGRGVRGRGRGRGGRFRGRGRGRGRGGRGRGRGDANGDGNDHGNDNAPQQD